jgi:putative sterol carrier protein
VLSFVATIRQTTGVSDTPPETNATRPAAQLRYLSLDWINALSAEVAISEQIRDLAQHHSLGVTQVISGGPEGDVTYHLLVADGHASFGAGAAEPEDVKMEQDWKTAVDVATGELNAQEAFIGGRIRLFGDQQKLLESQPVFGALDSVFASVRDRTIYA